MEELRVTVVSDTHLSPRTPEADANWDAVVRHVERTAPDLVVHLGDLALDGAHDAGDLDWARPRLDRLPVPWHAIPGNHDVGDNPTGGHGSEPTITPERRQRWLDRIGPDRWVLDRAGWTLLALDAQLFGSGLSAEAAQWAWLADELAARPADRPIALLTHKPLAAPGRELASAPSFRFVPVEARRRLEDLLDGRAVPLVLSGHVHQFRVLDVDSGRHVWAPTTWAVLPDSIQATFGAKRCGVVEIALGSDRRAHAGLVEPDGLAQHTAGRDIPDPYDG
jgi:3',5'-cyclic AMP phosphodiesterase CpdA